MSIADCGSGGLWAFAELPPLGSDHHRAKADLEGGIRPCSRPSHRVPASRPWTRSQSAIRNPRSAIRARSADHRQLSLDLDGVAPSAAPGLSSPERRVAAGPFNYTDAMRDVVADVLGTLEELRHVDLERVLIAVTQARQASKHGVYARCVPLRFEGGASETVIGGRRYRMPPLRHGGREILYLLYFTLPRFHDEQEYDEKLATVIHELYHISPRFDGDIRRFPGKNFAHGHSREVYHAAMRKLAARYRAHSPRGAEHEFLHLSFSELQRRYGGIIGTRVTHPKAMLVRPGGR